MKKLLASALLSVLMVAGAQASDRSSRFNLSTGLLYECGWDATLSVERETRYHNVWEFFANLYLKWEDCPSCGHICPNSFWDSYNTWTLGAAYKPMVFRTRNVTGLMRLGGSLGSDTENVIGGIHIGYEQNYKLQQGPVLFWQLKTDMIIGGKDLFRTGAEIGIKFPF